MNKKSLASVVLLLSLSASAQFARLPLQNSGGPEVRGGFTGGNCLVAGYRGTGEEDVPLPRKIDHIGFVYARVRYHTRPWYRYTHEIPWHHDYPDGDTMFPASLGRLTLADADENSYQLVDIDSKDLFNYPFVYMSEPGYLNLLPADARNLREYLDRGGFLLIDDFRGNEFDNSQFENMMMQMRRVFPDREIKPIPPTHPIFNVFYEINPQNMYPPYLLPNSGETEFLGISDAKGNLQVMIDFNNDISEYWQALDVGQCSLHDAGVAVELGVNYAIYAMTH